MKNQDATRYLVYARKSTDDQDNQKNSIAYQVDACLNYAKSNGLPLSQMTEQGFVEDGIIREKHTAYKSSELVFTSDGMVKYGIERPKFSKLAQRLQKDENLGVIVLCWDRISRNDQDSILVKSLIDRGVDIQFVQVTYDKTSSGALHRDIDGMFAAHYSRVISEKVRNQFEKFRQEGRCIGPSPIGYLDEGSDNKPLDPERAPLVKRVFEQYATGEWSLIELGKWAKNAGLTTKPSRAKRTPEQVLMGEENNNPKVSRPVNEKSIENILKNPFYIGKHRSKDGRVWDCSHQPLIDASLFHEVQQTLKQKNVTVHYQDKPFFTFRGLLRCRCGRAYSPYMKKGITYYRCRCKHECTNRNVNVRESVIDAQVQTLLQQIHFTDDELAEIEAGAQSGLDKIAEKRNKKIGDLESERKRIYRDLDYLKKNKISLLRNGVSTSEEYAADTHRLQSELSEVETKMGAYSATEEEMLKYVLSFSELVKNAYLYYQYAQDQEKRQLVTQMFSELTFYDDEFEITPKDGFSVLFQRHKNVQTTPDGAVSQRCCVDYVLTELPNIYPVVRQSMERLQELSLVGVGRAF